MNESQSIFEKKILPYHQALAAFGVSLIISLFCKGLEWTGLVSFPPRFPWMIAASFMLLYAVGNSIFSVSSDNMAKYWGQSIYSFMGLAAASGLVAWGLSGLSIGQAGSYRWIYIVVTIGYLVFLSMMGVLRTIVAFAQREEWNQPRKRK